MGLLFDKDTDTIGLHLKNIYKEQELDENSTTELFSVVQKEGNRNNYIDENTLTHLAKKEKGVKVLLLAKSISRPLELDVQKANEQYGNFTAKPFTQSHDRFLIIDGKEVYHLGASLKDLGKRPVVSEVEPWFAFSKLEKTSVQNIMNSILELI